MKLVRAKIVERKDRVHVRNGDLEPSVDTHLDLSGYTSVVVGNSLCLHWVANIVQSGDRYVGIGTSCVQLSDQLSQTPWSVGQVQVLIDVVEAGIHEDHVRSLWCRPRSLRCDLSDSVTRPTAESARAHVEWYKHTYHPSWSLFVMLPRCLDPT
jgi:hypothetical protein